MTIQPTERDSSHDRAIRLFRYLKELSALRSKTVRSIDGYDSVIWLSDIPREPGCYSASWFASEAEEHADEWLVVRKPDQPVSPPLLPVGLAPWVDDAQISDSSLEMPELRPEIDEDVSGDGSDHQAVSESGVDTIEAHPEVQALWEQYVQEAWWPWAEEDRNRKKIQSVYSKLFSIYQRQQRLGEQYEVVLGIGLLAWRTASGQVVKRHLLSAQTGLIFDPITGTMTAGPAGEGAKPVLEQDMLDAVEQPDPAEQRTITEQLERLGDDVWQEGVLGPLLSAWVHAVSPRGRYERNADPNVQIAEDPVVRFAPALILRRRTERSLIRMFQDIIDLLEDGTAVPHGVRRLLEVVDDAELRDETSHSTHVEASDNDIYFPLPANDEQREIVGGLKSRQGVLVQGPPGTGKSHTIANLVSHLLATGNRVLVTSHTPRALRVLRDKVPSEIAPLCVSLLGDDRVALQSLEDSVHGITDRFYGWDPQRNAREIEVLASELDAARRSEALTLKGLLEIRGTETTQHSLPFGGYEGTAETIARRVASEAPRHSWIKIRPRVDQSAPLTNDEAVRLHRLLRELSDERADEARKRLIPTADLVTPAQFRDLVARETAALALVRSSGSFPDSELDPITNADAASRNAVAQSLDDLIRTASLLQAHPERWVGLAASQLLAGRDRAWQHLRTSTIEHLTKVESLARHLSDARVVGLEGRDLRVVLVDATELVRHLSSGGKWGLGPFRPEPVKRASYLVDSVTIDGRKCNQIESLQLLLDWLKLTEHIEALGRQWEPYTEVPAGPIAIQAAGYRDLQALLDQAVEIIGCLSQLRAAIARVPGLAEPHLYDLDSIRSLRGSVEAATHRANLKEAGLPLQALAERVVSSLHESDTHEVLTHVADAVEDRDTEGFVEAYETLLGLERDRSSLLERDRLVHRLRTDAPQIARDLENSAHDTAWDERFAVFEDAWNWARADQWLAYLSDPHELQARLRELHSQRERINDTMERLAAEKAWRFCFCRMTEAERQNLMAWMQAVRRLGKGTGKYASEHRQAARKYMDECKSAIPAWIMPIYRVAETVRPGTDAFDVVIVDEASQSGPEALFLQFIAKKIVVVGDDQQISPESIGISREDVAALQARYIADLHFRENLGVDNSFFDQAVIRFGGRIRLREHFRCMPEIIQFSNNLSYRSEPLYPLRQYGMDRLPPIRVVHVADGYRQGESQYAINPPEAQAVVDQIASCCQDPAYFGKTMGVISLQGEAQARKIEELLIQTLGPEEIESRQIVCGNAYAFQGDERDIIFMSMVAARTEHRAPRALSGSADVRRFNVAASRARDQVWLFHTATLNDLNSNCLRYKLLEYYTNPTVATEDFPVEMFDSQFEQDVFRKIKERGYRVRPQVEVAGYRIDLVIDGMQGSIAVECDGEKWHGPDRYQDDMARQRHLERCGWTFWRVRGGTFYRDPDFALNDLWDTLERLGIFPAATSVVHSDAPQESDHVCEKRKEQTTEPHQATRSNAFQSANPNRDIQRSETVFEELAAPSAISQELNRTEINSGFSPYEQWESRPLPSPLETDERDVLAGLLGIIDAEGPMPCHRAYRLYASASGIGAVDLQTRSIFNKAVYRGVQKRWLVDRNESGAQGQMHKIVRLAGRPPVRIRERGERSLDEIPPSEIAASLMHLAEQSGRSIEDNTDSLFNELLDVYGLEPAADSNWQSRILEQAIEFLRDEGSRQPIAAQLAF